MVRACFIGGLIVWGVFMKLSIIHKRESRLGRYGAYTDTAVSMVPKSTRLDLSEGVSMQEVCLYRYMVKATTWRIPPSHRYIMRRYTTQYSNDM